MTSEELREACVMAGLERDEYGFSVNHGWVALSSYTRSDGTRVTPIYHDDDPALPAYVASLLVAKIENCKPSKRDPLWFNFREAMKRVTIESQDRCRATDVQRISAAMEVLRD